MTASKLNTVGVCFTSKVAKIRPHLFGEMFSTIPGQLNP